MNNKLILLASLTGILSELIPVKEIELGILITSIIMFFIGVNSD